METLACSGEGELNVEFGSCHEDGWVWEKRAQRQRSQ